MVTTKQLPGESKILFYFNEIYLGYAYQEIDGLYVFVFKASDEGSWSGYALRWIADKLDELNKDWNKNIEEYFAKTKSNALED